MFTSSILSLMLLSSLSAKPADTGISSANTAPVSLIAEYDPSYSPGKEMTDDPHGPSPYGRSPSGELHDKKLPANSPEDYMGGGSSGGSGGSSKDED